MLFRWLILIVSLILAGCNRQIKPADDTRYVKVFIVGNSLEETAATFHGVVHAEFEPNLAFRVNGKIIKRNVDIGQSVKQGQILASLDASDYELAASSSNAQLASAKALYIKEQANLERYGQLLKQNFVSQAQYDTQKAQYENAKAQYLGAQNQLANSRNQVNYTVLKAPADGVITAINMDAGQVVTAAQTVATMAVSGNQEVEIDLPETQINNYKIGMPALVKIWATDKTYQAKIRIINQASDSQTRTYAARIAILNPDDAIKYGMAADVMVNPLNSTPGVELPLNCLYAKDGKTYVWLVNQASLAQLVPISVLSTDGRTMQIKPGVLHNGDKIVSAGTNLIYPQQKLQVYAD